MTEKIPLFGQVAKFHSGSKRGLVIHSSDCEGFVSPRHVNQKHEELQNLIDRRKVRDGVQHGWIEHDGEEVTDWNVDDRLLKHQPPG